MTLPAAASIQGLAPFYTDARVFNTSYAAPLEVTATYRCFLADCPGAAPRQTFTLGPRESAAFDDIVARTFHAPGSAGGVEFAFDGPAAQLVVTSRLYSTAPSPTVGMFVPGLPLSKAFETSVLTSVRNRGPGAGFRTNVGVFNPGDQNLLVILTVFADGIPAGSPVVRTVLAHSGVQVNAIFAVAGAPETATSNGAVAVSASGPVFSYAAVIDNETTDPYLVVGAADRGIPTSTPTRTGTPPTFTPSRTTTPGGPTATLTPSASPSATPTGPTLTPTLTPSGPTATRTASHTPTLTVTGTPPTSTPTPTPSRTPTGPSPTPTRTPSSTPSSTPSRTPSPTVSPTPTFTFTPATLTPTLTPSSTPTPTSTSTLTPTPTFTPTLTPTPNPNHVVFVGQGGNNFVDSVSGTNITTIAIGQTVEWQWVGDSHSTTSGTCGATNCIPGPPCPLCTPWDSGVHNTGFTFTQTFGATNTYTYFCTVHGVTMQGTIVVNP